MDAPSQAQGNDNVPTFIRKNVLRRSWKKQNNTLPTFVIHPPHSSEASIKTGDGAVDGNKNKPGVDLEANGRDFESTDNEKYRKHLEYQMTMSMVLTFVYQFAKEHGWDYIVMACMGATIGGLYLLKPAAYRFFPFGSNNGQIVYPQFAYPSHDGFIIPVWLAAILPLFIPTLTFLLMELRIRSFWDLNNAFTGLLYSHVLTALCTVVLKNLIGGLRPHFLAVCKPNPLGASGQGFNQIMFTREICQGNEKEISFAMTSFPSGHTSAAFAGFTYLFLYLNAKLKVWSNYHPAFWKLALLYAPILGAVLIACSVVVDYNHNWYDVLAGAVIGNIMAFSAYRVVWASIWDFRYNHIPLKRHIPFNYNNAPDIVSTNLTSNTWTRKAGWGAVGLRGEAEKSLFRTASVTGLDSGQVSNLPKQEVDKAGKMAGESVAPVGAFGGPGSNNSPAGVANSPSAAAATNMNGSKN